jgi:ABC-type lipoprotein export system ATPase subunit
MSRDAGAASTSVRTASSVGSAGGSRRGVRVLAQDVRRCYGRSEILHGVSFVVEPSELVVLTGASGSGKTTLLQLIGSLDRPTSGRILVGDIDVGNLQHPAVFRRDTVGFVFQLHYLLPALTAQQNVELPMVARQTSRRERAQRALALLEEVGLGDRGGSLPAELSGGERQRVAIARALINEPPLVLADEPTGALDSVASRRVWELLEQVRTTHGATIIVASHEQALADSADRVMHMLDGRLVDGSDGVTVEKVDDTVASADPPVSAPVPQSELEPDRDRADGERSVA